MHENFTEGDKDQDKEIYQIKIEFPTYKKVRKTAVTHDVMQRKPCRKKRRNSIAFKDRGLPRKTLEEYDKRRTQFIDERPEKYVEHHLKPMRKCVYIAPTAPFILRPDFTAQQFVAEGYGNNVAEFEAEKYKAQRKLEMDVIEAQYQFDLQKEEAKEDAKHEYWRGEKLDLTDGVVGKIMNFKRRHSQNGRKNADFMFGR